ncbi:MAG: molecular chaperone HtpG [Acidobacteria bacterium]|nr:molecular chaperone HtpG [Acidobacteriota bacterium]
MATATVETLQFQAETRQLLDLMIHSLYSNKEIFLRELISNSSDALDRLRFEALTRPELLEGDEDLKIRLEADRNLRTLSIHDNGIGMSREEVIANIGTIAKSGTRELVDRIKQGESKQSIAELIGQFGVGFYSSFMAAERVVLVTRRAGETAATRWESTGDGTYTVEETEKSGRGTSITLYLKPEDKDNGVDEYSDRWVISRIVRRYSDFVSYPIVLKAEKDPEIEDLAKEKETGEKPVMPLEEKTLNTMKPIWTRPQSEVKPEDYTEFYKHIAHDWTEPLKVISYKAEGRIEYQALLFVPAQAPYDLYYVASKPGLQLYVKRIQILEKCEDLLPQYLRFVRGVVDSPDLALNVSREMLQQDRFITLIRKGLTKKILDVLQEMREKEPDTYLKFWAEFGRAIKEGVSADYENKEKLLELLVFQSSHDPENPEKLTTLKEYVERMKEGQNEIFYLTGESRSQVENSPNLEAFKEKGYEVLYLVDTVDELLTQSLHEYGGKKLKSAGKGTVALGSEEEKKQTEEELKAKEEQMKPLLDAIQKKLDTWVKQVRLTNRLTNSPVCLVGAEHDYSPQLEKLLQKGKGGGPKQRRILELNPKHEILTRIGERFEKDKEDPVLEDYAQLLFGYGLIAEGGELPDPVRFNKAVADLMARG